MRHGFARVSDWALVDSGSTGDAAWAVFALEPHDLTPQHAQAWPHDFLLQLRVTVGAGKLAMALEVHNRGAAPFAFSSALHTYHLVEQAANARIDGLQQSPLAIGEMLDQIFHGIDGRIALRTGAGVTQLAQQGFTDAVVWNPGAANAAAKADLADDEYERFVCIEPAVIEPLTLQAGASWRGDYSITAPKSGSDLN
jgi:glucose-6-phosphate 1-epimerase